MVTATRAAIRELAGEPGGWRDLARCAEVDPEMFFPEKGEPVRPAKRVAATAPGGATRTA